MSLKLKENLQFKIDVSFTYFSVYNKDISYKSMRDFVIYKLLLKWNYYYLQKTAKLRTTHRQVN
jgi:hypothetical protein